jgi:hypothetical protein
MTVADYIRSGISFRKNGYLLVKAMLPKIMVDYIKVYYAILLANGKFYKDTQCPLSLALGGDPGLDAVLEWIRPEISRLVGFELTPTYSYTRLYAKGDVLKRHTDRPACEISVSISISVPAGAEPSTLFLKPSYDEVEIKMFEGDGCVYVGTEIPHWREPFSSDGYNQLFLHFIVTNGRYFPEHAYGQRERLGSLTKRVLPP